MKFLLKTSDRVDFRHTIDQTQLGTNDPILQGAQGSRIIFLAVWLASIVVCVHRVVKNLPEAGRYGPHHGFNARGHITFCLLQTFIDQVAGKVNVRPFFKYNGDLRERISRQRAGTLYVR